jgi:hypothetical protein
VPELVVRRDTALPAALAVGRGTAVFVNGACWHRRGPVQAVSLLVDGRPHAPTAWGMPRLDLFGLLHPGLLAAGGHGTADPASEEDPEVRCYRSGFWATLPVPPPQRPRTVELALAATLADGREEVVPLGAIPVADPGPPAPAAGARIAVCLATHEPDPDLLAAQIASLRAQTETDWVCVISDDGSSPERFDVLRRLVEGDDRFRLSRAGGRLGAYRNFERALRLAPADAEWIALCDQDDRWDPDKLAVLRAAAADGAALAFSDMRLVDRDGRVLRPSLWGRRRVNTDDLASLVVANSVTGAAALLRRDVVDLALPFPDPPGWQFHDHWLALVALATGRLAYVDRPLYDYVQHGDAVVGQVTVADPGPVQRVRRWLGGWRGLYFYGYVPCEVHAQALLARCDGRLDARRRRALARIVAADRRAAGWAWLALRPLRALAGRNETLGTEAELARGILWRRLLAVRTGRRRTPDGSPFDAACPPPDLGTLGHRRLARWRAGG